MRRPVRPTAQPFTFPAPMGGLNTVSSGTAMPLTDCVDVWNLIAAENGLRTRLGYREWATGLTGSTDDKVRTLLSFSGSVPTNNRLFATTETKIYNVTESDDTPEEDYTFPDDTGDSGYGVGRGMVTSAGHFLLYCDEENGLVVYAEDGGTWTAPTMGAGAGQINNVDPTSLVHVTVFKERIWYTARDSASAWYMEDAGAIYGNAVEFDFGRQFKHGGHLVGLWNWTYDGGAGLDDSLVAISSAGDVVIYSGTDPSDPDSFGLRGVWYMGPPPTGRDIVREVGGDLYLLSTLGLIPISQLVVGAEARAAVTAKINNLFTSLMLTRSGRRGWSMRLHPEENALIVLYPDYSTETDQQLALTNTNKAWFRFRDVPMHCAEVWEGQLYFGTQDGRVCVATGYLDNVTLEDSEDFNPVEWSLLTSFQQVGGGTRVQAHQTRTLFVVDGAAPVFAAAARFDYDQTEAGEPVGSGNSQSGIWGSGLWGEDLWGGRGQPYSILRGATGDGHLLGMAVRGEATARTTLVSVNVSYEMGGWL